VHANSVTKLTTTQNTGRFLNEYMNGNTKSLASKTTLPSVAFLVPRGGAAIIEDDDSEYDLDEYDDESEEEEEDVVQVKRTKLSSSAVKASAKVKNEKTKQSKKVVNASLSTTKKKKVSNQNTAVAVKKTKRKLLYIPYIIKALLNPFTVFSMTRGYFASLVNIDYLKEDTSQTLRSALQEKAKQQGGQTGGKRSGRGRKMKPGQAKTLSDLPQLSA